eukprot:763599-Hanusia_phi.AAC.2
MEAGRQAGEEWSSVGDRARGGDQGEIWWWSGREREEEEEERRMRRSGRRRLTCLQIRGSDVTYRAPLTSLQRQMVASKRKQEERMREEEQAEPELLNIVPSDAPARRLSTMTVRPLARHSTIFNFMKLPAQDK